MNTLIQKELSPNAVHSFCTSQALKILINDYDTMSATKLYQYLQVLNKGNAWCDEGFKSIHHFYHPKTKKGIMGLTGADHFLMDSIKKAQHAFKKSSLENSLFYIGSALHLIQDLCVPHHALGHLLKGHSEYENWVLENHTAFSVLDGGMYSFTNPIDILEHNALTSSEYADLITNPTEKNKIEATKDLLGLAQRSSTNFLYLVFKTILPLDSF